MPPTLYIKGSLIPINPKVKKAELDQYTPVHYVVNVCQYKLNKRENVNIHDRLFLLKSETGSGKTTTFIIELFRALYIKDLSMFKDEDEEKKRFYKTMLPSDFSVYDFPDDKWTIKNKKNGIRFQQVTKKKHILACTQPKTFTAVEKAKENAAAPYNPDIILGENIAFSTGNYKFKARGMNQVVYMTLGSMYQRLKLFTDEEIISQFDIICVDECHERSIELDCSILYIKNFLIRNAGNPDCPLIIFMSATFDLKKFANYMGTFEDNSVFVVGEGSTREIIFLKEPSNDYINDTINLVMKIHKDHDDDPINQRDILIFCYGRAPMNKIKIGLEKLDTNKEFIITVLESVAYKEDNSIIDPVDKMTLEEAAIFLKVPNAKRRVSIATPVIETGITIPTLKYVIETGWENAPNYSPIFNINQLIIKPVTQSSATQRFGRVGRVFMGYALPMYTKDVYDKLDEYKLPDIYTNNITKNILEIMYADIPVDKANHPFTPEQFKDFVKNCLQQCSPKNISCNNLYIDTEKNDIPEKITYNDLKLDAYPPEMLDKIPQDTFLTSRNKLIRLGFYGTYPGYIASKIARLSAEGIRTVMAGFAYGVSMNDLLTIVSLANSGQSFIYSPFEIKKIGGNKFNIFRLAKDVIKKEIIDKYYFGDIGIFLNIFHDDFLRGLLIVRWVVQTCKRGHRNMDKKCLDMGINFRSLMTSLDDRMLAADDFNKFGFTNIYPELDFESPKIIEEVCKIKKCIYAGYKCNTAFLNEKGLYVTNEGLEFRYEGNYIIRKPKKIVYSSLSMRKSRTSILYETNCNTICSLDGIL